MRPWSGPIDDVNKWSICTNWFEPHWYTLDSFINKEEILDSGSAKELTITKGVPRPAHVEQLAALEQHAGLEVKTYLQGIHDVTQESHRRMNCSQLEFWILFQCMQMALSHLPRAHAFSDLETVEELLEVGEEYIKGMRYLVKCEHRVRREVDHRGIII
ncbi:hypothetical protein M422DRAFT_45941 [Sphaerobolus stellatus SS14]|uniref:Unplaced genomic scaffold SPHSTscaffold_29, whole genome shotgun sequence n=1 Tax=Sphaerobolus stellatus (strain SS14) TaxID=990650 RepID=A0A0C9VVK6_SPHS4|nr:hypothetical protein M422DRAFT_45941 [Sphaerobolus stellatus SS14]